MAKLDELEWLMRWYRTQCDGEWEHSYGVEIGTLDNPGWSLKINLTGTSLEGRAFEDVSFNVERSGEDPDASWYACAVRDLKYEAFGGALDLPRLIGIFREWVEGPVRQAPAA